MSDLVEFYLMFSSLLAVGSATAAGLAYMDDDGPNRKLLRWSARAFFLSWLWPLVAVVSVIALLLWLGAKAVERDGDDDE